MASTFDIGDLVRITGSFSTASGTTGVDPSKIQFLYSPPVGANVVYSVVPPSTSADIVKAGVGEFYVEVGTTGQGLYEYRWTSTGVITASEESWFSVRPQRVTT